jgi:hypothetical protein
MNTHTIGVRRFGLGLGLAAGAASAALIAGPTVYADIPFEPPCSSDICGTAFGPFLPYFPFEYTHQYAPATDYTSEGSFYFPPGSTGFPDVTGFDITSGHTDFLADFQGVAGETVLYTDNDGVISAPIELLPFAVPL